MTSPLKYATDTRGGRAYMPHVPRPAIPNDVPIANTGAPAASQAPAPANLDPYPPLQEKAEPGFYIVSRSMSAGALYRSLFDAMPPAAMPKFSALNPHLTGTIKAGSLIVLSDPENTSCTYREAQLMQAAQEVKEALDPLTPEQADFMMRHQAEIAGFLGQGSTWLGVSSAVMQKHLVNLRDTLQAMERLHQDSYRKHGHLRAAEFLAERKRLLAQLDAHLLSSTRLHGHTSWGDHPKLKTALGISSRSLVHHWDKAGSAGAIPGYTAHVKSVSNGARFMQAGGYIGIGIGGASALVAIRDVCGAAPDSQACRRVRFTETGKFAGSAGGGYVGTQLGIAASGYVCAALGVSTGIGGVVCVAALVGLGGWAGTSVGGERGEAVGDLLYRVTAP